MARYREPFTLYSRQLKNKTIWYYRTYDEHGNRTAGRSTGQTTKTAARSYCMKLYKEGNLLPKKSLRFGEYAENWWVYDKCGYIKSRLARGGSFSRTHADNHRLNLNKHILPTFKKYRLEAISSGVIERWLFALKERGLSNTTANHIYETLRIMLKEAFRLEMINSNPCEHIMPLKKESKRKGILSMTEVSLLLEPKNISKIWGKQIYFAVNLLARPVQGCD